MSLEITRDAWTAGAPVTETADAYPHVLAASARWRVIRCRGDLQVIVQFRKAGGGKYPWRAVAYVYRRAALPAILRRHALGIPAVCADALLKGVAQ